MWVNTIFNYKFKNQLYYCVHFAYLPLLYLLFYLFLKHCLMLSFRCKQDEHCSIQARSWQNCCSGKATTITYYECVFVALVIHHTVRMRPHMWSVRLHSIFPNYPINGTIFEKKIEHKICGLILSVTFFWNICHYKKNWVRYDHKYLHVKCCYSCHTLIKLEFYRQLFEKYTLNFMKIHPVDAELFHEGELTDDRIDMKKLTLLSSISWTHLKMHYVW
jgi:hypothetical protein